MTPPYKGLAPYELQDQYNFFGRQKETEILLGKLLVHKLTLLYAATGVGKTSLLKAAVMPALQDIHQENLDVIYYRHWSVENPIQAIQEETCKTLRDRKKIAQEDLEHLTGNSLKQFFAHCQPYASVPCIVIFDQFEEVFTQYAVRYPLALDELIEQLTAVLTAADQTIHFVLSLREDFLAELSVFRGNIPQLYSNYYRLQKLTPVQAKEAIENPVNALGFEYEPELLKSLLRDLIEQEGRDPHHLSLTTRSRQFVEGPYLQIVCQELWRKEQNNPTKILRHRTYIELGGADQIVQTYIKNILAAFSPTQQQLASHAFTFLVTEQGAKIAYPITALATLVDVPVEILQPVLDKLTQSRILRDEKRSDGQLWYELYHDVFTRIIRYWNIAYLEKRKRLYQFWAIVGTVGVTVILGVGGYAWYNLHEKITLRLGTLIVNNPDHAELKLTLIRDFDKVLSNPEEQIFFQGASVSLTGPADYMLTAHSSQTSPEYPDGYVVKYPVFIVGFNHTVQVTVTPPPSTSPPSQIPEDLVYIPAGVFRMGDKDDRDGFGNADEQPAHDVYLDGFWIDKTEVTNKEYQTFVATGGYTQAKYWGAGGNKWLPEEKMTNSPFREDPRFNLPDQPVVGVSWYEASAYCLWKNQRLPTEAEWEKAAAGPEGYKWFVTNEEKMLKQNLNFCDKNCKADWPDKEVDDGYSYAAPVGHYRANGYGLYDMSGNVWEWVEDWYDNKFYGTLPATAKNPKNLYQPTPRQRVLRGGAWLSSLSYVRVSRRHQGNPEDGQSYYGFRCARDEDLRN